MIEQSIADQLGLVNVPVMINKMFRGKLSKSRSGREYDTRVFLNYGKSPEKPERMTLYLNAQKF